MGKKNVEICKSFWFWVKQEKKTRYNLVIKYIGSLGITNSKFLSSSTFKVIAPQLTRTLPNNLHPVLDSSLAYKLLTKNEVLSPQNTTVFAARFPS